MLVTIISSRPISYLSIIYTRCLSFFSLTESVPDKSRCFRQCVQMPLTVDSSYLHKQVPISYIMDSLLRHITYTFYLHAEKENYGFI